MEPLDAGLLLLRVVVGLFNGFRMVRMPDVKPKADLEEFALGG